MWVMTEEQDRKELKKYLKGFEVGKKCSNKCPDRDCRECTNVILLHKVEDRMVDNKTIKVITIDRAISPDEIDQYPANLISIGVMEKIYENPQSKANGEKPLRMFYSHQTVDECPMLDTSED